MSTYYFTEESLEGMRQFQKATSAWGKELAAFEAQLMGTVPPNNQAVVDLDISEGALLQMVRAAIADHQKLQAFLKSYSAKTTPPPQKGDQEPPIGRENEPAHHLWQPLIPHNPEY
jgi:hypothetical protein